MRRAEEQALLASLPLRNPGPGKLSRLAPDLRYYGRRLPPPDYAQSRRIHRCSVIDDADKQKARARRGTNRRRRSI